LRLESFSVRRGFNRIVFFISVAGSIVSFHAPCARMAVGREFAEFVCSYLVP
jgi:hypothetical protein